MVCGSLLTLHDHITTNNIYKDSGHCGAALVTSPREDACDTEAPESRRGCTEGFGDGTLLQRIQGEYIRGQGLGYSPGDRRRRWARNLGRDGS